MSKAPHDLVEQLAAMLLRRNERVCTAESCTGGLIAKTFTDLAGSSVWFERGFVTYSNEAKHEMLAVSAELIQQQGAVSEAVALAMASGALSNSQADYAVAVTGVAGPGGGSDAKPVGTVWVVVAAASSQQSSAQLFNFLGDREAVREASSLAAIEALSQLILNQ